jgi:hypothetical protein
MPDYFQAKLSSLLTLPFVVMAIAFMPLMVVNFPYSTYDPTAPPPPLIFDDDRVCSGANIPLLIVEKDEFRLSGRTIYGKKRLKQYLFKTMKEAYDRGEGSFQRIPCFTIYADKRLNWNEIGPVVLLMEQTAVPGIRYASFTAPSIYRPN